jgi:hypothetical protein
VQDQYLPLDFLASSFGELTALISREDGLGIDGIFLDCPVTAAQWLRLWHSRIGETSCLSEDSFPVQRSIDEERPSVKPATAVSVFAIVGTLVVLCAVWVVVNTSKNQGVLYKEARPDRVGHSLVHDCGEEPPQSLEMGVVGDERIGSPAVAGQLASQ